MNGKNSRGVKTISMMDKKLTKEITPVKIILDTDNEIRATNFYGTSKTGKSYISPQIVFMKATGKQKTVDIALSFNTIDQIILGFKIIREENSQYFNE